MTHMKFYEYLYTIDNANTEDYSPRDIMLTDHQRKNIVKNIQKTCNHPVTVGVKPIKDKIEYSVCKMCGSQLKRKPDEYAPFSDVLNMVNLNLYNPFEKEIERKINEE